MTKAHFNISEHRMASLVWSKTLRLSSTVIKKKSLQRILLLKTQEPAAEKKRETESINLLSKQLLVIFLLN